MRYKFRDAFILAGIGIIAGYGRFKYLAEEALKEDIAKDFSAERLQYFLAIQTGSVFLLLFMCALSGIILSRRAKLPLYKSADFKLKLVPWLLMPGPILAPISYYLHDQFMVQSAKAFYPSALLPAFWIMLSGGIMQEIVARLGMLTIIANLIKRKNLANALNSAFFALVANLKAFSFTEGDDIALTLKFITVLGSLATNYALGWTRMRYGIIAAFILGLSLSSKYPIYAIFFL